jgi:hypothetical protein
MRVSIAQVDGVCQVGIFGVGFGVMKLFYRIRQFWSDYKVFRATVKSWLGDGGGPVTAETANKRAAQCLDCDFNQIGTMAREMASDATKRLLGARARLKMSVPEEELLHTCVLCRCNLKLKVHVPMVHIRRYQPESVREVIRAGKKDCWQLRND